MVIDKNAIIASSIYNLSIYTRAHYIEKDMLDYIEFSILNIINDLYGDEIVFLNKIDSNDFINVNNRIICPNEKTNYTFEDIEKKYRDKTKENLSIYNIIFNSYYINALIESYNDYILAIKEESCDDNDKTYKLIPNNKEC